METKEDFEKMKEDSKKLFKDPKQKQEFCKWCDKKLRECECKEKGEHTKNEMEEQEEQEEL